MAAAPPHRPPGQELSFPGATVNFSMMPVEARARQLQEETVPHCRIGEYALTQAVSPMVQLLGPLRLVSVGPWSGTRPMTVSS